jgi:hypothetical protein
MVMPAEMAQHIFPQVNFASMYWKLILQQKLHSRTMSPGLGRGYIRQGAALELFRFRARNISSLAMENSGEDEGQFSTNVTTFC